MEVARKNPEPEMQSLDLYRECMSGGDDGRRTSGNSTDTRCSGLTIVNHESPRLRPAINKHDRDTMPYSRSDFVGGAAET
jgi:hypothetical protein